MNLIVVIGDWKRLRKTTKIMSEQDTGNTGQVVGNGFSFAEGERVLAKIREGKITKPSELPSGYEPLGQILWPNTKK